MSGTTIVILGNGNAALAVARNAHDLGATPLVFDTRSGPATATWLARVELHQSADEADVCALLRAFVEHGRSFLIATDDYWLDFLVRHRGEIERSFAAILHPTNEVLLTCLSKRRFGEWCHDHGFASPRVRTPAELSDDSRSPRFPLLVRPEFSHSPRGRRSCPKAIHVTNLEGLRHWLGVFARGNVQPVVTDSLLGHRLRQYSVGVARGDGRMASFVTEKVRPWPEACGMGTYVALRPDAAVESLARRAVETLDYYGIAEVEILRSLTSGHDYLVEINARPWRQYALAPASGHDFLRLLLQPDRYEPHREVKTGKQWIDFRRDLSVCFSRRDGLVRHGKLSLFQYLLSLLRPNVYAKFSLRDPRPSWHVVRRRRQRRAPSDLDSRESAPSHEYEERSPGARPDAAAVLAGGPEDS
jgi:predicted ATP-grasp superfamily ATP-dependent carboligase